MLWFSKFKFYLMLGIGWLIALVMTFDDIRKAAPIVDPKGESGIALFYQIQSGFPGSVLAVVCYFLGFLIIPMLYSEQAIRARLNHFDYLLIARCQNLKTYWWKVIKTNAVLTFSYCLSILGLKMLAINLFYQPFYFQKVSYYLTKSAQYYVFKNGLWNLIAFILFSCLGLVVFSTLVLIIGLYLRNYVAYLPLGIIVMCVTLLVPFFIGVFFVPNRSNFLGNVLSLNALVSPAEFLGNYAATVNGGVVFGISILVYSCLCFVLFALRIRLDEKKGI